MSQQQFASDNPPVIIGIDWADREHVVCLLDGRTPKLQVLVQDPAAIAEWLDELRKKFPQQKILVAIEQSRGALVHALQAAPELEIYPINPKQLARYREAIDPSGRKNDLRDAELLAQFLLNHQQDLRAWKPDDELTRKIGHLSQMRRKLVDDRKRLQLRLNSILKLYFPLPLTLFKQSLISKFILALLKRWPSLDALKITHPKILRRFFADHRIGNEDQQTQWIDDIRKATPLTRDPALVETHALLVQCLARQIAELNRAVHEFEESLRQAVAQHPDQALFRAIPGAGDALVPRLIVAFGTDRDRYQSAEEIQSQSGIAPITKRSGQSWSVFQRFFCPTFLKQTFHEFADQARKFSQWSKAFYDLKRDQGMKHQAAVRALAFKWIRVLFRLWKSKLTYSEATYINQLRTTNSPLITFLPKMT